jgi:ferredoxin
MPPPDFFHPARKSAISTRSARQKPRPRYNEAYPHARLLFGVRSGEQMAYVIAEPCIGTKDTACIDACPVDCIHPKKDEPSFAEHNMIYIDPVECIDCGACVPVCPVSAIFALDDLPEKWGSFTKMNAEYFGR